MSKEEYFKNWIISEVLPFWYKHGVAKEQGFYEAIDFFSNPLLLPTRSRLVSRQIYSFLLAKELGWEGPALEVVEHGLGFLEEKLIADNGQIYSNFNFVDKSIDKKHDTYDYAFLFLALSKVYSIKSFRQKALEISQKCLAWLDSNHKHNYVGYLDDPILSPSMKSNPHMHLLEAALEWLKISAELEDKNTFLIWKNIADSIVELADSKLIDPNDGSLSEFFDQEWNSEKDYSKRIVEPGHLFEWGWLLLKWSYFFKSNKYKQKALRLIDIAENRGKLSKEDLIVSELDGFLEIKDDSIKLWPQTERIKAWYFVSKFENFNSKGKLSAHKNYKSALNSLLKFVEFSPKGMWFDVIEKNIKTKYNYSKASSLYHIILSIHTIFFQ